MEGQGAVYTGESQSHYDLCHWLKPAKLLPKKAVCIFKKHL